MTDCEQVLSSVDIFADFPREFVRRLAASARLETYAAGDVVVRQGDAATAFFVVTSGSLEVLRSEGAAGEFVAATLGPGRFFGEMALLREGHRTATVRAREASECLILEKSALDAELRKDPNSAAVLATRLARRINMIRPRA
ncbi:MAG TPA: cyclic nucleotide-binding domain-containing protein [Dehalococcoidia bacterium]|nr:cyclic nucleotide-binding domain-containing protein [Dehalococcoidia bacterium]